MGRPAGSKNKPKPVIQAREISPWGDASAEDFQMYTRDAFYIEGYSDKRARNDVAKVNGRAPEKLDWRLQYVSVQRASGAPDGTKKAQFESQGYHIVKYDDLAAYGIKAEGSGFTRGQGGECQVGSQIVMACPGPRAAANAKRQQDLTDALSASTQGSLEAAGQKFNAEHGLSRDGGTEFTFSEEVRKDTGR